MRTACPRPAQDSGGRGNDDPCAMAEVVGGWTACGDRVCIVDSAGGTAMGRGVKGEVDVTAALRTIVGVGVGGEARDGSGGGGGMGTRFNMAAFAGTDRCCGCAAFRALDGRNDATSTAG